MLFRSGGGKIDPGLVDDVTAKQFPNFQVTWNPSGKYVQARTEAKPITITLSAREYFMTLNQIAPANTLNDFLRVFSTSVSTSGYQRQSLECGKSILRLAMCIVLGFIHKRVELIESPR